MCSSPPVRNSRTKFVPPDGKSVPLVRVCGGFPAVFARRPERLALCCRRSPSGRLRFGTCIRAGEPGQNEIRALLAQIVRAWRVGARLSACREGPRCSASWRCARKYGRLVGHQMRPGADYSAQQLKEIVGYLGEYFTGPLSLSAVAAELDCRRSISAPFPG